MKAIYWLDLDIPKTFQGICVTDAQHEKMILFLFTPYQDECMQGL